MRTKLASFCLAAALVAVGCGNDRPPNEAADRSPAATDEARGQGARPTPDVSRAPEGEVNRPKPGKYVYELEGSSREVSNPNAQPNRAPTGAQTTHEISNEGDITTQVETSTIGPSRYTVRTRWTDDRVVQLSGERRTEGQRLRCEYDPPIEILHIPLRAEEFEPQPIRGAGACEGTIEIEVTGEEETTDADGRTWQTWKIVVRTRSGSGSSGTTTTETKWFSPDLGKDIRVQGVTESAVQSDEGNRRFRSETENVLTSYPS